MDLAKIGQFIKDRRKEKNLTQLQLSIELGGSEKTVSKWESGNGLSSIEFLPELSIIYCILEI